MKCTIIPSVQNGEDRLINMGATIPFVQVIGALLRAGHTTIPSTQTERAGGMDEKIQLVVVARYGYAPTCIASVVHLAPSSQFAQNTSDFRSVSAPSSRSSFPASLEAIGSPFHASIMTLTSPCLRSRENSASFSSAVF